ncbi:RsfA family transcriptional regulator [Halobacillus sp. BBL2006]|uniref:RsfA family transcriptional regulator n=1 Tax=Halobacillus sp. BBL2006 TaxID=1543706 RepID=UPI000542A579|nr:RsfA family transcriptional regulator [Halobacillus sp. BBL2006]KHE71699.1 transcriptional regulator [Halobacillus sp. BBL2006]
MPKVRQDAWSHEDDLLLAETVLRHIREGSTQLKAFDEVGDVLNRTSAACGFRWNAEVRQKYEQAVELAKKQRKEKKRKEAKQQPVYQEATRSISYQPEQEEEQIPHLPEKKEAVTYHVPAANNYENNYEAELNLSQVIRFLKDLQKETKISDSVKEQITYLENENKALTEQNRQLNRQLESMSEDYQSLIQIMDRARKMVMFDDQEYAKPQFRMEKNGNLENVAR